MITAAQIFPRRPFPNRTFSGAFRTLRSRRQIAGAGRLSRQPAPDLDISVVSPVQECSDLTAVTYLVGGEGSIRGAFGDALFHGPRHCRSVGRIGVHVGEAAGAFGGIAENVPDVGHGGGAGAGRVRVKGSADHPLIPGPVDGVGHVLRAGRAAATGGTVQEGQDLGLGAVLIGRELGGRVERVNM